MKTTYISRAKFGKFTAAIAAAALLAGTAAPGVLAADYTAQLTKTVDMTAAPGAGVPHGSITFTVGTVANLPSWAAGTAVKGTAAQIKSTELTAAFTGARPTPSRSLSPLTATTSPPRATTSSPSRRPLPASPA